jgi:hypothetical protein
VCSAAVASCFRGRPVDCMWVAPAVRQRHVSKVIYPLEACCMVISVRCGDDMTVEVLLTGCDGWGMCRLGCDGLCFGSDK